MTSLRKLYANRRNAQRCTGPKTAAGKARSARNASRHGLTRPARADPAWTRAIAALAQSIVRPMGGAKAGASCRDYAEQVASAHIELIRVRQARRALYDGAIAAGDFDAIKRLASLERYERRAFARRQAAIRRFDAARRWYEATADFGQNETTGRNRSVINEGASHPAAATSSDPVAPTSPPSCPDLFRASTPFVQQARRGWPGPSPAMTWRDRADPAAPP